MQKRNQMNCPCCSGKSYEECCAPFHRKEKHAPTAEALMRSRYAAYAIPNGEYLMETTHPGKRKFHDKADMQEWGEMNQWVKLEIVRTPALNHVEFKAHFINSEGREQIHHEFSYFQKMHDRWYYVSGDFME